MNASGPGPEVWLSMAAAAMLGWPGMARARPDPQPESTNPPAAAGPPAGGLLLCDPFDGGLYRELKAKSVAGLDDLARDFREQQAAWLPILVPDPGFIHIQDRGVMPFRPAELAAEFVEGLGPVEVYGVAAYPVAVLEHVGTRQTVFLNALGRELAVLAPLAGYDPAWYVRQRFPGVYEQADAETIARYEAIYDPARVVVRYLLIAETDLADYVRAASSTPPPAGSEETGMAGGGGGMMAMGGGGGGVSNLWIRAVTAVSNRVELTVGYPAGFTNELDIIRCTNLSVHCWELAAGGLATTSGASLVWRGDELGTNPCRIFYVVGNGADQDGDGVAGGREYWIHRTDPFLADTDTDGMPDGWEIEHGLDPLSADGAADPDADGYSNLWEYALGSDPRKPNDLDALNLLGLAVFRPAGG